MNFNALVEATNTINSYIEKMRGDLMQQVKPALVDFIKQNPQVKAVHWTQYTPYFNDGEVCEFNVNSPSFEFINDPEVDEDADEDDWYERGRQLWGDYNSEYNQRLHAFCSADTFKACKKFEEFLQENTDTLKALFGDHAKVSVTQTEVIVEEYDHE